MGKCVVSQSGKKCGQYILLGKAHITGHPNEADFLLPDLLDVEEILFEAEGTANDLALYFSILHGGAAVVNGPSSGGKGVQSVSASFVVKVLGSTQLNGQKDTRLWYVPFDSSVSSVVRKLDGRETAAHISTTQCGNEMSIDAWARVYIKKREK